MANLEKFPSVENVHEVLTDLHDLFDDRTKLLSTMFKEDKYKDFLMAENIQQIVEADKRDDATNNRIRADLADGYEVLKAKTSLKKFSTRVDPNSVPPMDLDEISSEDLLESQGYTDQAQEPQIIEREGPPGRDGRDGRDAAPSRNVDAPKGPPTTTTGKSQAPDKKLAKGGVVNPLDGLSLGRRMVTNDSTTRPSTKSSSQSLEDIGLVGDKNPISALTKDLGLDKYKKILSKAMTLPMRAVAAGLAGLLDNISMPGGQYDNVKEQVNSISTAFNLPSTSVQKSEWDPGALGSGTTIADASKTKKLNLLNPFDWPQILDEADKARSGERGNVEGGSVPNSIMNYNQRNAEYMKMLGGPSLNLSQLISGGGDLASSMSNVQSNMKTSISNLSMSSKSFAQSQQNIRNSMSSILTETLGGIAPADAGSSTLNQDINSLTNQVLESNEEIINEGTSVMVNSGKEIMNNMQMTLAAFGSSSSKGSPGIKSNPLQSPELSVSKYLINAISIVQGGETNHDLL